MTSTTTRSLPRALAVLAALAALAVLVCAAAGLPGFAGSDLPVDGDPSPALEVDATSWVIVKFRDEARVRLRDGRLVSLAGLDLDGFEAILSSFGWPEPVRLFTVDEQALDAMRERGTRRTGRALADLNGYLEFRLADIRAAEFARAASRHPSVQTAYVAPPPAPPPADIPPVTPDYESNQGYLDPAPGGIGARAAWERAGGRGEGIYVVDIEYDWNDAHEDLGAALGRKQCYTPNGNFIDHGTAVLGALGGGPNGYGVTGIVPLADFGMVTQDPVGMSNSVARAITCATTLMGPGDVLLLETQAYGPGGVLVPSEWVQAEYDAIATATALGITVVAAAGNGNQDLDDPIFLGRFDRSVRDSGAIIVGAGASPGGSAPDRSRLSFSNYGSRIDVQGWGHNVTTAGYGSLFDGGGDPDQRYTATFNGTSSASPVVTGAAAALQGIQKARGGVPLTSQQVRQILADTGTPQQDGPFPGSIGPRPDLAAAIATLADLLLESLVIDDAAPYGNADGILEPGETATLRMTVRNVGQQLSTGTFGVIATDRTDTSITDEAADVPDLPPDTSAETFAPHFRVTVGPQAACGDKLPFALRLESDQFSDDAQLVLDLGRVDASYATNDGPLTIPKTSTAGVDSTATASDAFTIADVQVTLDVSHENIGQLRIELQSPSGTIVVLHDHTGDGTTGLATTYDGLAIPDGPGLMNDFDGEPVQGTWTLTVVDDVGGPEGAGTLNSWTLDFVAETAYSCTPHTCAEPVPSPVGNSLLVAASGTEDLAFQWAPVAGAASYRVWRSEAPTMAGARLVGQTTASSLAEAGGLTDAAPIVYYEARSVNACEWEEP